MMIDEDYGETYDAQPPDEEMITTVEALALLGISRTTLYAWRARGFLAAYQNDRGKVFYKKSDVLETKKQLNSLKRI